MEFIAKHVIRSTIVLILLITAFGCSEDDSTAGTQTPGNGPTEDVISTPPIEPAPEDTNTVIIGKKNIMIDNRANSVTGKPKKDHKGYDQEGVWEQSNLSGHKNSISRYSSDPTAKVSYITDKVGEQRYCISVYRVTHGNSIDKANYEVFDSGQSLSSVVVNYKMDQAHSGWYHLGEFEFTGTNAKVELTRHQDADNGYLRADALRFKKLKEGHDCLGKTFKTVKKNGIIDNRKDENNPSSKRDTDGYRESGSWEQSSLAGYKSFISRYTNETDAFVTYTAKVQQREYCLGVYRVTHPNSVAAADIAISQNNTLLAAMQVNFKFQVNQSGWVALGRYQFNEDDIVSLKISRPQGEAGVLRADAIRFSSKLSLCD
jgi:hypothetical protein